MAGRAPTRARFRRASVSAFVLAGALALAACEESPEEDLATVGSEASPSDDDGSGSPDVDPTSDP
jgi:hypothetical protein